MKQLPPDGILIFGTVCLDRIRRVKSLPPPGGYVEILEELNLLGGEAANTATVLTAWGCPNLLVGNALGEDPGLLERLLEEKEVHWDAPSASVPTPICDIYVTPDGERTMFGSGFKDMDDGVDLSLLPFAAGHWFTAEPNMAGASREAVRLASDAGMKLYLMDFVREDDPIPAGCFWQSSTDWSGHRGNTQKNVVWVQAFVERNQCFAILSDGPNGFIAGSPKHPARHFPPFPAPVVVDTTGAGDMFRAGMLYGLHSGWEIAECLRFASAAGCLKCRSLGATSQVPPVDEIRDFIGTNRRVADQYSF